VDGASAVGIAGPSDERGGELASCVDGSFDESGGELASCVDGSSEAEPPHAAKPIVNTAVNAAERVILNWITCHLRGRRRIVKS